MKIWKCPSCHAADSCPLHRAAPELLEAIEEYLEWGAMTGSDRDLFHSKFTELAKKARGE
jgi:hypothetical protein